MVRRCSQSVPLRLRLIAGFFSKRRAAWFLFSTLLRPDPNLCSAPLWGPQVLLQLWSPSGEVCVGVCVSVLGGVVGRLLKAQGSGQLIRTRCQTDGTRRAATHRCDPNRSTLSPIPDSCRHGSSFSQAQLHTPIFAHGLLLLGDCYECYHGVTELFGWGCVCVRVRTCLCVFVRTRVCVCACV